MGGVTSTNLEWATRNVYSPLREFKPYARWWLSMWLWLWMTTEHQRPSVEARVCASLPPWFAGMQQRIRIRRECKRSRGGRARGQGSVVVMGQGKPRLGAQVTKGRSCGFQVQKAPPPAEQLTQDEFGRGYSDTQST